MDELAALKSEVAKLTQALAEETRQREALQRRIDEIERAVVGLLEAKRPLRG